MSRPTILFYLSGTSCRENFNHKPVAILLQSRSWFSYEQHFLRGANRNGKVSALVSRLAYRYRAWLHTRCFSVYLRIFHSFLTWLRQFWDWCVAGKRFCTAVQYETFFARILGFNLIPAFQTHCRNFSEKARCKLNSLKWLSRWSIPSYISYSISILKVYKQSECAFVKMNSQIVRTNNVFRFFCTKKFFHFMLPEHCLKTSFFLIRTWSVYFLETIISLRRTKNQCQSCGVVFC